MGFAMASPKVKLAMALCLLFGTDMVVNTQSSNSTSSFDASSSSSTNTSTDIPPATTSQHATLAPTTTSVPVVSGSSGQSSATSSSPSGASATSGPVPFDFKSLDNPYFVSFLGDVARQTAQNLQDLKARAVNDPQIAIMWDDYVQSYSNGNRPSLGGGGSRSQTSNTGSSQTVHEAGGQKDGTASVPTMNTNWFQSFFKNSAPSRGVTRQTGSSYLQYNPTQSQSYYGTNNNYGSAGPTYSTRYNSGGSKYNTRYSSRPSSPSTNMQQMFSFFHSPSSSRQQQYFQQNVMGSGMNSMNIAQRFMSMMSPALTQSLSSQSTNQQSYTRSGQAGTLPDSGWGVGSITQQQATPKPTPTLSKEAMERLSTELMVLLGKLPAPSQNSMTSSVSSASSSSPLSSSSSSSSSSSALSPFTSSQSAQQAQSSQTQTQPETVTQAQPQPQAQTQGPIAQVPASTQAPVGPVFSSQQASAQNNQALPTGGQGSGVVSSFVNFGASTSNMGMSGMSGMPGMSGMSGMPGMSGMSGMPGMSGMSGMPGMFGMPGISGMSGMPGMPGQQQQLDLSQQPLDVPIARMNMLTPIAQLYNARYNARASRDLGCRTLGEMLDMDVPRAMDLTCHRMCPNIMPGAVTGKRFGLTCLCCPAFVSDRAIGMRSMYRRAEALT